MNKTYIRYAFRILLFTFAFSFFFACTDHNAEAGIDETTGEEMMQDGVWEGTGEGRNGTIIVRITVKDHKIVSGKVVSQSESSFAQEAINTIIAKINGRDNELKIETDGMTGATLTSTGVIAAINMAILTAKGKDTAKVMKYEDTSCDVVIIGAGGAGLAAAVEAADNGAKVIILEKQGIIGGNTNYSTGGINASETSIQRGLGINDSNQLFYDDTMKGGYDLNFPNLVKSLVEHSASTVDWLVSLGADLSDVGLMGGSSVKRTHRPKGGTAIGSHLMKILKEASGKRSIDIRTNNKVTGLIAESGKVVGVTVEQKDGTSYTVKAKATIIATGGFGANIEMVTSYQPKLKGFSTLNHKGATGDAFPWVTKLGGDLIQMEQIQIHPTAEATNHILITEAVRGNGAILVNQQGARFVNEMETRDAVSAAILSQEGAKAYLIFDQGVRKSLASIETYANQGLLKTGNSVEELARSIECSSSALQTTLNKYNEYQSTGNDKDYGRSATQMTASITTAPFYAVAVTPAIHHTMGGLHVDADMHVLKADGSTIQGLYAAGEVTGGVHGGNRLGGNGVADIMVNGKIAGHNASLQK